MKINMYKSVYFILLDWADDTYFRLSTLWKKNIQQVSGKKLWKMHRNLTSLPYNKVTQQSGHLEADSKKLAVPFLYIK